MKPTDVKNPSYFHKVVDCQWACPAHTNVPEYIRLIAQGQYTDAYLLNRDSNVFPGILGRTCDRPCEPACRRTRIDEKPVAICRLKRVAADLRDDVSDLLPAIPAKKNGKRVACIGAGPGVARGGERSRAAGLRGRDLRALRRARRADAHERADRSGCRARCSTRRSAMILDRGVEIRYGTPVASLKALLDGKPAFDAVFVGTGAPRGKELDLPGRHEAGDRVHIGIDWLAGVAFGHIDKIGERVLIIGVGNTAMDCCRTSRRLGGKDVKVMARRPRQFFKASPWELDDAEEEQIEILVNHVPKRFVVEAGKLMGMEFERVEWRRGRERAPDVARRSTPSSFRRTTSSWRSVRRTRSRGSSATRASSSTRTACRSSIAVTMQSTPPGVYLRRRLRVRAEEHHLGRRARARGGDLDSQPLQRRPGHAAPRPGHEPHHARRWAWPSGATATTTTRPSARR